jgi:hypothetical protein
MGHWRSKGDNDNNDITNVIGALARRDAVTASAPSRTAQQIMAREQASFKEYRKERRRRRRKGREKETVPTASETDLPLRQAQLPPIQALCQKRWCQ